MPDREFRVRVRVMIRVPRERTHPGALPVVSLAAPSPIVVVIPPEGARHDGGAIFNFLDSFRKCFVFE